MKVSISKTRGIHGITYFAGVVLAAALGVATPFPALGARAAAQQPSHNPSAYPGVNRRVLAVSVVRLINTGENTYKHTEGEGRYATWNQLRSSQSFKNWEQKPFFAHNLSNATLGPAPEIAPNFVLRLTLKPDASGYNLSLTDTTDKCKFSFFSNERGLIYQGTVIGCSEK